MALNTPSLPSAKVIHVDTRGAIILSEESPETRDSRGIYLPNHIEPVSHIAVDVGGSLAKVVYFTRSPDPPSSPSIVATRGSSTTSDISSSRSNSPLDDGNSAVSSSSSPPSTSSKMTGALTPLVLEQPTPIGNGLNGLTDGLLRDTFLKRSVQHFPGGSLNFERFETDNIDACVEFIQELIQRSAQVNGVTIEEMRKGVKIMATGGGAHKFYELFSDTLGVEVRREDEMECLIEGLKFITLIPDEVYFFSDELIQSVSHPTSSSSSSSVAASYDPSLPPNAPYSSTVTSSASGSSANPPPLERPSPDPPKYGVTFESNPTPQLPCLLVNIGSGVSLIKVDEDGAFERVSGTSLGGGTLWGLLSLLTPATTFDEMLAFSEGGDNSTVDMLVGDIYGQDYSKLGLKSTMIASTFGKVFKKGGEKGNFSAQDISKSLLYAVSNNIGQIAYMNAEKYNLDRIYFGGCFIRGERATDMRMDVTFGSKLFAAGHAATIATLSYAIRFWSKGTKRALFLRHEGFFFRPFLPSSPTKMSPPFDSWPQNHNAPAIPHQQQQQSKKPRHRHSPTQLAALNHLFDQNEHPPLEQRSALADRLGMETKTVNAWFQNKRASSKKRVRGGGAAQYDPQPINTAPPPLPLPSLQNHDMHRHNDMHDILDDDYLLSHSRSVSVVQSECPPPFYAGHPDHAHFYTESENVPRRMRIRPSSEQTDELRKLYNINPHPSTEQRTTLARSISMRYESVTNWFQNQRSLAKKRKEDEPESFSPSATKAEYPHETRQYSAFPPPSLPHPSLGLPPLSAHPPLVHANNSVSFRSPSVSPSMDDQSPRRSSRRSPTPYGSMTTNFARPRRSRPEPYQLDALKVLFTKTSTPTIEERSALALEIGMDVGKVTNWFRNLRQTARKRSKKSGSGDDEDDDSYLGGDMYSASASRFGTPSFGSSSSSINDYSMDMDDFYMHHAHSDGSEEDDYQEAVTPSPEHSPSPPRSSINRQDKRSLETLSMPYSVGSGKVSPTGINYDDAMLLISFQRGISGRNLHY
ncbi:hypothetical protein CVT25_014854 [Psilocybe cyanescens]|uniref:Homeobox domain-containing protein n=1 Tax=Psilocybe cyanescens TaxID=93625 RepID=A0A409WEW4_PSICY|nr:hypothetical protein CVT25_014854 [Psilocybe cyanescens]